MKKTEAKFNKKPDFKKMGEATKKAGVKVKNFLAPYGNLEKPVLSSQLNGFLSKNIKTIYVIGLAVLVLMLIMSFGALPCFSCFLGSLLSIFVIFIIFRLLCEQIYHNKK